MSINNKTKNILCVHSGCELYGSDRSFLLSIKAIKKCFPNAKVTVLIPMEGPIVEYLKPIVDCLIYHDMGILRTRDLKRHPLRLIYKIFNGILYALSISRTFDIVYINTIVIADFILAARFMTSKPIIHVREIPVGFQRIFFSFILKFSQSSMIFNSKNTKKSFMFLEDEISYVLLNGVCGYGDIGELKLPKSKINLLVIGRINSWKGQAFFIDTLAALDRLELERIRVRIVGDVFEGQDDFKEVLYDKRSRLNLIDTVEILPFTKNPVKHYMWSDIVVVPSIKPEPFGRVAAEAMSAGRCVIAAAHGGLLEIVNHKETGLLFEPGDMMSLAKSIKWALNNQDSIEDYGRQGKIRFQTYFGEDRYISNYGILFKKAAGL